MPPDPLEGLCFALRAVCFAHQDTTPLFYDHAISTKFGFDWPFRPSKKIFPYIVLYIPCFVMQRDL